MMELSVKQKQRCCNCTSDLNLCFHKCKNRFSHDMAHILPGQLNSMLNSILQNFMCKALIWINYILDSAIYSTFKYKENMVTWWPSSRASDAKSRGSGLKPC